MGRRRWVPVEDFPFRPLRYSGLMLVLVGAVCLSVNIADLIYTDANFSSKCADSTPAMCSKDLLKWTWISSGVWGGLFIMSTGVVGMIIRRGDSYLRKFRDVYGAMVVLTILLFGPAVIILQSLEIYKGSGVYYYWVDDSFVSDKDAKLVLPIVVISVAFVAWVCAIITAGYVCCYAHFETDDYRRNSYYDRRPDVRLKIRDHCHSCEDRYYSHKQKRPKSVDKYERDSRARSTSRAFPYRPQPHYYPGISTMSPFVPVISVPPQSGPPALLSPQPVRLTQTYGGSYTPYGWGSPWSM